MRGIPKFAFRGEPDEGRICTSHVERNNLTVRMSVRRFARVTNAFSKRLKHLQAAVAFHFCWYNFCRVHTAIRCTPASPTTSGRSPRFRAAPERTSQNLRVSRHVASRHPETMGILY